MIEDAVVALSHCVKRGNIFERTCKDVGLTRFIDLLHWEGRSSAYTNAVVRVIYEWVLANPAQSLDVLQRCHSVFLVILTDVENWPVVTKERVLNICYMITTDADDGIYFLVSRGYLDAIVQYIERSESVRHKDSIVIEVVKTICNIVLGCLTKSYATQDMVSRICDVPHLVESLCTLVIEPIPLRQLWAMRTIAHLLSMTKHFGFSHVITNEAEEQGMWDTVADLYNTSPDEEMIDMAQSLLEFQDKTRDYDDRF